MLRLVLLLNLGVQSSRGFYVPGVAPTDFKEGDRIDVRAVKMTSSQTQLPFEYYSLEFCKDKEITVNSIIFNHCFINVDDFKILSTPCILFIQKNNKFSFISQ